MERRCDECLAWVAPADEAAPESGSCRANPPGVVIAPVFPQVSPPDFADFLRATTFAGMAVHPTTLADHWCLFFEPRDHDELIEPVETSDSPSH